MSSSQWSVPIIATVVGVGVPLVIILSLVVCLIRANRRKASMVHESSIIRPGVQTNPSGYSHETMVQELPSLPNDAQTRTADKGAQEERV